jgi:hypothetical protein
MLLKTVSRWKEKNSLMWRLDHQHQTDSHRKRTIEDSHAMHETASGGLLSQRRMAQIEGLHHAIEGNSQETAPLLQSQL